MRTIYYERLKVQFVELTDTLVQFNNHKLGLLGVAYFGAGLNDFAPNKYSGK